MRPALRTRLQRDRGRISARITALHVKYRFMPRRSSPTDSASRRYLLYLVRSAAIFARRFAKSALTLASSRIIGLPKDIEEETAEGA